MYEVTYIECIFLKFYICRRYVIIIDYNYQTENFKSSTSQYRLTIFLQENTKPNKFSPKFTVNQSYRIQKVDVFNGRDQKKKKKITVNK